MTTLILAALACSPQTAPIKAGAAPIGINLAGPADWNSELPFTDAFKLSREWISQREGAGWGQGPKLALDTRGYPKAIEPGAFAETLMFTDIGAHYPGGEYTITYKGRGRIGFNGPVTVRREVPGRFVAAVDNTKGYGIYLRLLETDPKDPVRDIHVWMPGFADGKTEFHPAFLKRWKGVVAFRFMDWAMTNGSTQSAWADRPKPEDATWTTKGIPVETMVRLCNEQDADAWLTMPHRATDEYVSKFAAYVAANLELERKAYIAWSNEVWNASFEQHRYAAEQGAKLKLGPDQYHNA